jgi:carbonic anhydrase
VISLAVLGQLLSRPRAMLEADCMTPQSLTEEPRPKGAADALDALLAGNRRFVSGDPHYGHEITAAAEAAASGGQEPYAVVIGCIDSRVPLEAIFDQNFGSMCVVRSGGTVLDQAIVGSVEFAVTQLNVPLVMVLGHERCGAVSATVDAVRTGEKPSGALGYLVEQITPAVEAAGVDAPDAVERAIREHIVATVRQLRDEPELSAAPGVRIVGAIYDLDTGEVTLLT